MSETEAERVSETIAALKARAEEAEAARDLHAGINRRAALALGKPTEGAGSSMHDIPECIDRLRARCDSDEATLSIARDRVREWIEIAKADKNSELGAGELIMLIGIRDALREKEARD